MMFVTIISGPLGRSFRRQGRWEVLPDLDRSLKILTALLLQYLSPALQTSFHQGDLVYIAAGVYHIICPIHKTAIVNRLSAGRHLSQGHLGRQNQQFNSKERRARAGRQRTTSEAAETGAVVCLYTML